MTLSDLFHIYEKLCTVVVTLTLLAAGVMGVSMAVWSRKLRSLR